MLTKTQAELIDAIRDCLKHGHIKEARETIQEQIQDCYKDFRFTKSLDFPKRKSTIEYLRQLQRL